jgi:3-oxoacyl-[acyl-carrier protein] reductase
MKSQRYGRIVNLASVVGRAGAVRVTSHYAAAKAGVIGFTRHLALEVGAHGITVNAVAPGTTATERVLKARTPEETQRVAEAIPVKRGGRRVSRLRLGGLHQRRHPRRQRRPGHGMRA